MTTLEAVLLGIVQGFFMFVPVSSTSHLALTQHWLISRGSNLPSPDSPEMILFDLVVHVGTLVSMAVVFRGSLAMYLRHLAGAVQGAGRGAAAGGGLGGMLGGLDGRHRMYLRLTLLGGLTLLVTGAIGFPMKSAFERIFATPMAMSITLVCTGILLWWTDVLAPRRTGLRGLSVRVAVAVGVAQGLALMPGLSRSGTTIAFGLFAGLRRRWAAEYSFFVAFPTILGATAIQSLDVIGAGQPLTIGLWPLFVGFAVSAFVGVFALMLVLRLLYRARFRYFSYYVWALAAFIAWNAWRGVF